MRFAYCALRPCVIVTLSCRRRQNRFRSSDHPSRRGSPRVAQIIGTRLECRCMLPPDLILHNGKIITLDQSSRIAQAISVQAGQVVAVGDDAALLKASAPTTQLIDLAG